MSDHLRRLSEEELLTELSQVADAIDDINQRRDQLYAARKALFAEGRRRQPPIGTRILGEAARVSDVLVTNSSGVKRKKKPKQAVPADA